MVTLCSRLSVLHAFIGFDPYDPRTDQPIELHVYFENRNAESSAST